MNSVKEVVLLPVNSFELESHLAEFGLSLLKFSGEFNFSFRCAGIEDCDLMQSIIIELTAAVKTDFIAFYGVARPNLPPGSYIRIKADEHPFEVIVEAINNARELKLNVVEPALPPAFRMREFLRDMGLKGKNYLYRIKKKIKDSSVTPAPVAKPEPAQLRLLMSTLNPNTIFTLTPVQDKLRENRNVAQLYIVNRLETYRRLVNLKYAGIVYGPAIRTEKPALRKPAVRQFVNAFFSQHFTFGKATEHFKKAFYEKLMDRLHFVLSVYQPIKKTILEFKPQVILISSCSTTDAQVMIHLAEKSNIPVIEMTHGMFQDTPLLKFQNVPVKLVWCERQRDLMKKYRPEVFCPVIGNPKHDDLLHRFSVSPPTRKYGKPYVLFASTPGNNISISWITYVKIMKDYIEVARQFPGMLFIMKLHPSEDKNKIAATATALQAPANVIIEKETSIYELVYHAEIVMVLTSTVGFEALLWDKKLICYTIPNSDKWLPFGEHGLAKEAANADELSRAISYFQKNPSLTLNNPMRNYFAFSDGQAVEKILSFIFGK